MAVGFSHLAWVHEEHGGASGIPLLGIGRGHCSAEVIRYGGVYIVWGR